MTVSSTTNRNSFTCTGVKEFPFNFKIFAKTDLVVILRDSGGNETTLTLTTDYTISAGPWPTGGTLTTVKAYATANTLLIIRELPQTQAADYLENDPFPAETHEEGLDRGVMLLQELSEKIARMLILAKSSSYSDLSLPDPVANKYLAWRNDLTGLKNVDLVFSEETLALTAFTRTLLDDADAAAFLTTLLLPLTGIYLVDASEADQGVTGGGKTIKAYVDAIGVNKKATLFCSHSGVGNETAYTLTTDITVPSNITLKMEPGAILDGAGTLTQNGPFPHGDDLSKHFGASITVVFGETSVPYDRPEWWDIDGTADQIEINKAIVAAVNIKTVKLQPKQYYTANIVSLNQNGVGLVCDGDYALIRTSSDYDAIVVTAEYPVCRNIRAYTTFSPSTRYGWWFQDGAKHGTYYGCSAIGFKRPWMFHSSTATGIGYNDFYSAVSYGGEGGIFGSLEGEGWVNENHWFGGFVTASSVSGSKCVSMVGNQNCFFGVCFQGGHKDTAAILELGLNYYTGCRFEVEGPVFRIANGSTSFEICSRISNNYYSGSCRHPLYALESGKVKVDEERFQGLIESGTPATDVVDADSAVDQKVLNISDTSEFYVGDAIRINAGGDRDEWGGVASIQAGISLTLHDDLLYTHTGVQADAVITRGLRYGINFRDPNKLDFWTYGVLVFQIASDGAAKLKGALSDSTDPTH